MRNRIAARIRTLRTAVWHLRKGGVAQYSEWRRRSRATPADFRIHARSSERLNASRIPAWTLPSQRPPADAPLVGIIMDEFSASAWSYEFKTVEVKPKSFEQDIQGIQLLFVESAWAGSGGAWRYQLTGSKAPSDALQALVAACNQRDIPTVFWNKEDPPHYDDFLDTARLFDHVFTTDENKLDDYRRDLGHDRVAVLGFAAQPALHNPVRTPGVNQARDIAFGGTYFPHKFPERRAQMDLLLGAAAEVSERRGFSFDIFSRFHGDSKYGFPEPLSGFVRGSLDYKQMLTAYRLYKVMLNVNSVTDSPTMLARRVFEILASGTTVVSTRSDAIDHWFGDLVPQIDDRESAEHVLRSLVGSPELRDRTAHLAQRHIWEGHTFAHRTDEVLQAAGLPALSRARPSVTAIASTIRPEYVERIVQQVSRQRGVDVQLALVTHGFEVDAERIRRLAEEGGIDVKLASAEPSATLGDNLNRLVELADGDVIAKFDDDDYYAPNYLSDALYALSFSRADVVGKQARYVRLDSLGATVIANPEREHRFTDLVAGPTLLGPRATFERVPFESRTTGEDTSFQRNLLDAGGSIYAADRFNFIQFRSGHGHTWQASDASILANGRVVAFANLAEHVTI